MTGARILPRLDQGPDWLYDLLYHPLAAPIAVGVAALVLVGAMYVLYRDGLEAEVVEDVINNGLIALLVWQVTSLSTTYLSVSYVLDVAIGFSVGVGLATVVTRFLPVEDLAAAVAADVTLDKS